MNAKQYVYEIFKTNEANNGTDILNVGLPMFMSDIKNGKRALCPVALDFASLNAEYEAMTPEERRADYEATHKFISAHYNELVEAYPDRDAMLAIVNG